MSANHCTTPGGHGPAECSATVAPAERRCQCGHKISQHELRAGGLLGCYLVGCLCIDFADERQCSDCGSLDRPIHPDSRAQRGEPICTTCAARGAFAP